RSFIFHFLNCGFDLPSGLVSSSTHFFQKRRQLSLRTPPAGTTGRFAILESGFCRVISRVLPDAEWFDITSSSQSRNSFGLRLFVNNVARLMSSTYLSTFR